MAPRGSDSRGLRAGDGIPLYVKLANLFRDKIARGDWPPGSQIGTLPELQAEYGVARATLQQAIRILSGEGLISSTRGRGTFVTGTGDGEGAVPSYDMLGLDRDFRIEMLSHETCMSCDSVSHPLPAADAPFVHVRKRHHFRDRPYSLVDLYLPKTLFDQLPPGRDDTLLYAQLLRDNTDIAALQAEQHISIMLADQALSQALDIQFAAPVARIDTSLHSGAGRHVMAHRAHIRGDMFRARRSTGDILHTDPVEWRPLPPVRRD